MIVMSGERRAFCVCCTDVPGRRLLFRAGLTLCFAVRVGCLRSERLPMLQIRGCNNSPCALCWRDTDLLR